MVCDTYLKVCPSQPASRDPSKIVTNGMLTQGNHCTPDSVPTSCLLADRCSGTRTCLPTRARNEATRNEAVYTVYSDTDHAETQASRAGIPQWLGLVS